MFKHTVPKKKNDAEGSICENENVEAKIEDIESDSENDNEDDDISENKNENTFLNPSQSDDSDAKQEDENVTETVDKDATATEEVKNYKCELCMFQTADSKRLQRHTFENHSVQGKYICHNCKQECENRKQFNNHRFFGCGS